jgi:hypothetical protein
MFYLMLNFTSLEELQDFTKEYQHIQTKKQRPKKENDLRGSKTKEFHNLVKIYHQENPDKSYLDCLKEYKENNKNV